VQETVSYLDDPFADSSALPVYILSKKTRQHVTVALSGDGADEIFSGYNKHEAWQKSFQGGTLNDIIKFSKKIFEWMPKSRSGKIGNLFRQLLKYSEILQLSPQERYWFMATFQQHDAVKELLSEEYYLWNTTIKNSFIKDIDGQSFNNFLLTDTKLVLPNDMLTKVDMMSMANHLEVRVPFLDHKIVDFAFSLPASYKIQGNLRKRILQDAFKDILPTELYKRPKKGFEVPLLPWFRNELKNELKQTVFDKEKIQSQGIFNWQSIHKMEKQIMSNNPGDVHAKVWAQYVFQKWTDKYDL